MNNKANSKDIITQAKIVKTITEKWAKQIKKEEVIIIGDFNIHNHAITANEIDKTAYEKSLNRIMNVYKEDLINNGMKIMNNKNTYFSGDKKMTLIYR